MRGSKIDARLALQGLVGTQPHRLDISKQPIAKPHRVPLIVSKLPKCKASRYHKPNIKIGNEEEADSFAPRRHLRAVNTLRDGRDNGLFGNIRNIPPWLSLGKSKTGLEVEESRI